jgi:hypothetical protein
MNNKQIYQLERAKQYAILKGGECLSDEYKTNDKKMLWKCSNHNHQSWTATFANVVGKEQWCPKCGKESMSAKKALNNGLEQAKQYALSKGGECLSTEYISTRTNMLWKCSNQSHNHWFAPFSRVVSCNTWCRECSNEQSKDEKKLANGLKQAQQIAQSKNGTCLSTVYINSHAPMKWKCSNQNHSYWMASFSNVKRSSWCPECGAKHLSEIRVRLIFERYFGKKFPTCKPAWNINPCTGKLLELDGFCKELNIAFEHDGEHHFGMVRRFGKYTTIDQLLYQIIKDSEKKNNCKANGISLINIPIVPDKHRHNFKEFLSNVIMSCASNGLNIQFDDDQIKELENDFYTV